MNRFFFIGLPTLIAVLVIGIQSLNGATADTEAKGTKMEQEIASTLSPEDDIVVFDTTAGQLVLRFFPDVAPKHVESFVKLSKDGFYDGLKFHRVIKGFMIQGGCPNTKDGDPATWGTGGPGYNLPAEFNDKKHVRGILSMARAQDPNSAGSQFFVMHGEAPFLNNQYTVFGQLVYGYDILDKIATAEVTSYRGEASRPVEPVEIKKAHAMTWEQYEAKADEDTGTETESEAGSDSE